MGEKRPNGNGIKLSMKLSKLRYFMEMKDETIVGIQHGEIPTESIRINFQLKIIIIMKFSLNSQSKQNRFEDAAFFFFFRWLNNFPWIERSKLQSMHLNAWITI